MRDVHETRSLVLSYFRPWWYFLFPNISPSCSNIRKPLFFAFFSRHITSLSLIYCPSPLPTRKRTEISSAPLRIEVARMVTSVGGRNEIIASQRTLLFLFIGRCLLVKCSNLYPIVLSPILIQNLPFFQLRYFTFSVFLLVFLISPISFISLLQSSIGYASVNVKNTKSLIDLNANL